MSATPKGVIGIFTDESGNVIASVSDFDNGGAAGISRKEAQTWRVKNALAWAVVRAYASEKLTRSLTNYWTTEIVNDLVRKHGCKVSIIPVGYQE